MFYESIFLRSGNLRPRPHGFLLPSKDDRTFISRLLYKDMYQFPSDCLVLAVPPSARDEGCTRPTVKLSTLWLTRHKIGWSPPLFATHTTFSARSPPLSSPDGLASVSELIHSPYP